MARSANTVDYEPLPADGSQIRLVTIHPGGKRKKIKCTVSNFPFPSDETHGPEYEALSYVWGDARTRTPITLNSRPFRVTTNLESALRALRLRDKERLVWIDALCINQTSTAERSQEVRRMSAIYSRAETVIVWLGRVKELSDADQVDDDRVEAKLRGLLDALADLRPQDTEAEAAAAVLDRTGDPIYALRLLRTFFYRPWFNRIWVLQEITLAKTGTVVYGDMRIGWDRLVQAADALRRLQLGRYTHLWRLSGAARLDSVLRCRVRIRGSDARGEHPSRAHVELNELLWQTRFHEWTEPRDRLFGILGLVKGDDVRREKLLEVDYMKPIAEVFRDLSIFLIRSGMLSQVLCSVAKPMDGLPSWASSWVAELQGEAASRLSMGLMMYMQVHEFKGIIPSPNPPLFSDDLRQITIRGTIIDRGIGHIGKRFETSFVESIDARAKTIRARLIEWEDEMERQHCAHKLFETQAKRRAAWKLSLLHELPGEKTELSQHYDLVTDRENELPLARDPAFLMSVVASLDSTLGLNCDYRRPFVTVSGLMGSTGTNCDLRFGDQVAVLIGSGVPYLLRPIDQTEGLYRFVGCCWLPGLINLDVVKGEKNGLWKVQEITLV
ncbi:heterokaryon incompatibility protein-domain-containing protein [Annulohypoxylon truncatum]|uniref:heterokaryon incompatibility protein-domain-containing protein n=1 Tax=Annulohypoxylon truncatum TaxID=327061 RepID=UPI0020077BB0|nr:heterokaryon incompatibility protein-domain-containing protein [Annulohypoxylon truncatum]KAI1204607.1 heterokaryon incompatibility protein-domain-containing protein [Annulohypoxylon truncatum]